MGILTEEEVFAAAIQKPLAERAAFLDRACGGDVTLRAQVESLLEAHEQPDSLLDVPACDVTLAAPPRVTEATGTVIGPYKLLQEIGHGGMGVVYMAEQTEPVRRRVALKIIKPGMDTRQVIARFEAERLALSLMDHPNIAKVLDAGTTDNGRPYFVMELVKGLPITQYCDERRLSPTERLQLFLPVCQAIQHAHQKGIIHRDIKPSNVLVAEYDEQPVPKVIDFGVAKAISSPLTELTMFTGFGQVVGTLEYMSPEQARLNQLDIDTRSDVYSLGVLLYELLTGTTPFEKQRLRTVAWDEMLRIIREEEPPRPSNRLSTIDTLPSVAANRKTDPHKLSGLLRGELDWIVMKALDKERGRRYETANGLAMDIQRYLSDQPVVACPPNAAYRFRKFVRRHKRLALAASIAILALLVGTAAATVGLIQAESSRRQEARQRQIAQQNATRATDNLRLAISAVDELYTEASENWLRTTPRMQKSRRYILERALNFYRRFAELNSDPALQLEMALAWRRVGEINHRFENQSESLRALEVSTSLLEELASEPIEQRRVRHELAKTYFFRSKPLEVTKQYADAEQYARKAVEVGRELLQADPKNPDYLATVALSMHQLGHILGHVGRRAEAVAEHRNSRDIYRMLRAEFPQRSQYLIQLAHAYDHLAVLLHEDGDHAQAEAESVAAISMLEEAVLRADNNADVVDSPGYLLGVAHLHFGDFLNSHDRNGEAETSYLEARKLMAEQVRAFPDVGHYQSQLGKVCLSLAKLLLKEKRQAEARPLLEEALRIFLALSQASDEVPDYHRLADETKRVLDEVNKP